MKLYYIVGSCSLAVRIVMNELNIQHESIRLQKKKVGNGYKVYTSEGILYEDTINKKNAVPLLVLDDGRELTEVSVILQYLADKYNGKMISPDNGSFERYQVQEWLNYIASELHKNFTLIFYKNDYPEGSGDLFMEQAIKKISFLNSCLNNRESLVGDFSIADVYMFVVLSWCQYIGIDLKKYTHIVSYYNRILQRKSVIESLEEEGLKYHLI
ncbi:MULTISPECIES: glutathione S-transferase N-terminal domain-containing protein [Enterobacter]|uniref:glutathione S-transferase N-terminal domain-containing protein n=1 Tax=Enterobacter TaxID=547 RepID=UPI0010CA502C|nr:MULTISPECIES: glutathione S-transferase N-terminal domain-containing protein [Enterobacter]UAN18771.1 glutathione S-transferase family protein [Enterobacter asburiae]UAN24654.1 glutathione S-transferase family protein [Enterobacter sp. JBIWA003]UAN34200.1 glutathione S-transferase family protein [Enterobacter sp. JBIWA005]BBJ69920.1 glutathione S-transferase [Enterobacter sp. 18A13]